MSSTKPQALIVAMGDWYAVCRLPRILHQAGMETKLLVFGSAISRRTRYAEALPFEGTSVEDLAAALRQHLAENPGRYAWVIPGDDPTMQALGAMKDQDWLRPWYPVEPTPENLDVLLSTDGLIRACQANGLPVPASALCRDLEHAVEIAAQIGYPVFFKGEQSTAGMGVGRADDEAELRAVASRIPAKFARTFSIQKAIIGRTGSTMVFAWKGEAIQFMGSYKETTWPPPYGVSSAREFLRHPDLEKMAVTLARVTGYSGVFSFDWVHCQETDRCMIVEINPRPTPEITVGFRDGVDFAAGFRHVFCGGPKPAPLPEKAARGRFALFPQEVFRCDDERDFLGMARLAWGIIRRRDDVPWDDLRLVAGFWRQFQRYRENKAKKKAADALARQGTASAPTPDQA